MEMSFEQIRRIAANLGHDNLTVFETRRGMWRFTCGCGYESAGTALKKNAVQAAVYHFEQVANGAWYRPKFPGGPTHQEALERTLRGREKATRRANMRSELAADVASPQR